MIKSKTPISMSEAVEFIKGKSESEKEIKSFIKKFIKINPEKAKELRKKIQEMDLMKVREEHISKIIDLMPEQKEEINKIFTDVGLDENETNKILDAIKNFK